MKKLVTFDLEKLRSFEPCYDPNKYLPEDWNGTVVDILEHKDIPPQDRLWAVCREEFLSARLLRRFAIAQARTCRKTVVDKKEFDRVLQVCSRFADGKATDDELAEAYRAADSAARWAAYPGASLAAASVVRSKACSTACRMLLRMIRVDLGSLK